MILTNFLAIGVLLSLIFLLFIFWCLVVEKTISLSHETVNINPLAIIRSSKTTGMTLVKNFISVDKEIVSISLIIELILSLVLLSVIILLLPYKDNILIDSMGSSFFNDFLDYSFFLKMLLVLTLMNNFSLKNNLIKDDLYASLSTQLNKLSVVLFNLFVIDELSPLNTLMVKTYPGVLLSFFILVFLMHPQKRFVGKSIFLINSKKVLLELTWSLFITFYFFNLSKWVEDEILLIVITFLLLSYMVWMKRILVPVIAKIIHKNSESRLIKLAIKISFLNYIVMEAYDFF